MEFNKSYRELETRYTQGLPYKAFAAQLLEAYRGSLRPDCNSSQLKALRDDDLTSFFKAVKAVAFYSATEPEVHDLALIFSEAERRKMDVAREFDPRVDATINAPTIQSSMLTQLHEAYMRSRLFKEARLLGEKYPAAGLPPPPSVSASMDAGMTNRVYDVNADGQSMTVRSVDWDKGRKIVMVFAPNCGFSEDALDDIETDDSLAPYFKAHSILITPPDDILESKALAEWNKARPAFKGYVAYSMADWPELDLSSTPEFYFFRDGKLMSHHGGWKRPAAERKAELVKGMQSIGLTDVKSSTAASLQSEILFFGKLSSHLQSRYPGNLSYEELGARLQSAYAKHLKPLHRAELDDDGLTMLFQAAEVVAFYSQAEPQTHEMELIFSEAERRKMGVMANLKPLARDRTDSPTYQSSMVEKLYGAYMRSRLFEEARLLAKKYPAAGLHPPAAVRTPTDAGNTNRVYDVDDDGRSITLRSVDWNKGRKIVVVFSPGCEFSERALDDIDGDASLLPIFKAHGILISPPGDIVGWTSFADWNKARPAFRGHIAHSMPDWPELDFSGTPQFYFFSDGKLMLRHRGWKRSAEAGKAELVKGLQSIGLAPPPR